VAEFFITIQGDKRAVAKYRSMAYAAANARPAMELVLARMLEIEEDIFDTEGTHSGKPWAPISEEWWFRKYHAGLDTRILHATLKLRESLSVFGAAGQLTRVTNRSATLASEVEYAGVQNRARPLNKFTKADTVSIRKIISEWLITAFRAGKE